MAKTKYVKEMIELDYKTLDEAVNVFEDLRAKHGGDARLEVTTEWDYGDESGVVNVCYNRPYTLEENRAKREEKAKRVANRKQQWERLNKEFGDS